MVDIDKDEVGPPPLEGPGPYRLSDIARKVTAAGCTLDEVVIVPGIDGSYLDWAKNWETDPELAAAREAASAEVGRRAEEATRVAADPTAGW